MEVDFSQGASVTPQATDAFGLIIPGGPVRTDFVPVDGLKFSLTLVGVDIPHVQEVVLFALHPEQWPPNHGLLCYWQISTPQQQTGFELLGSLTREAPSSVFSTGWSEKEQVISILSSSTNANVTIGLSLEPLDNLNNLQVNNSLEQRLLVAQGVASDLFQFMQSFDTGAAGAGNMVVPTNIFDRWFRRFENRFRRDPNFFLKNNN